MVDALNEQIMKELLTDEVLRRSAGRRRGIADAVAQILIARYLERIADQATNICKEVIYMVRGDDVRHQPKHPPAHPCRPDVGPLQASGMGKNLVAGVDRES